MAYASGSMTAQGLTPTNQPKEIGLLMRMDGMLSGICQLRLDISRLHERLNGDPTGTGPSEQASPNSLSDKFSAAEAELRASLQLISQLHDKF